MDQLIIGGLMPGKIENKSILLLADMFAKNVGKICIITSKWEQEFGHVMIPRHQHPWSDTDSGDTITQTGYIVGIVSEEQFAYRTLSDEEAAASGNRHQLVLPFTRFARTDLQGTKADNTSIPGPLHVGTIPMVHISCSDFQIWVARQNKIVGYEKLAGMPSQVHNIEFVSIEEAKLSKMPYAEQITSVIEVTEAQAAFSKSV